MSISFYHEYNPGIAVNGYAMRGDWSVSFGGQEIGDDGRTRVDVAFFTHSSMLDRQVGTALEGLVISETGEIFDEDAELFDVVKDILTDRHRVEAKPYFWGNFEVGLDLRANFEYIHAAYDMDHASLTYQWLADGEPISGASGTFAGVSDDDVMAWGAGAALPFTEALVGAAIALRVGFVDADGVHRTLTSDGSAPFGDDDGDDDPREEEEDDDDGDDDEGDDGGDHAPEGEVTVVGEITLGGRLRADVSGLSDADGADFEEGAFQWLADGAALRGETRRSLILQPEHLGREISVRLTYVDDRGTRETVTSAPVRPPAAVPGIAVEALDTLTGEDGSTGEVRVRLTAAPVEDVVVVGRVSDATEARVGSPLRFTAADWSDWKTLTVTGLDDFLNDGAVAYNLRFSVRTDDLRFARIELDPVALTNVDDGLDRPLRLTGGSGVDSLRGGNGDDRLYGGGDMDDLRGGRGGDRMYGEQDDDRLYGEDGADRLYGGYDDDMLDGGTGDDMLYGEQGDDRLFGRDGDDTLDGGTGADTMSGGAGDDVYIVDDRGDVVEDGGGGEDEDTVVVTDTFAFVLSPTVENATLEDDSGRAGLTGNALDNVLTGNDAANALAGGAGRDTLDGGEWADTLTGGAGGDNLTGGAGEDLFRFVAARDSGGRRLDRIEDFERPGKAKGDRIDLSDIDADGRRAGDGAFGFGGKGLGGLSLSDGRGGVTVVRGNLDGDAEFEFVFVIDDGAVRASAYAAADFIL
jgi:Ca2+-binding RTX toxin-like protein